MGVEDVPIGTFGAFGSSGDDAGPRGARITKHAGPAFRWLACAAVGLPVVFA